MSEATDAWEMWQQAKRALQTAMPWTAEWLRLRMVEQDRRAAYFAILDKADEFSVGPDPLAGRGDAGIAGSGTGAEDPF